MKARALHLRYSGYVAQTLSWEARFHLSMDLPTCILIVGRESSFTYLMQRYSAQSAHNAVFAGQHDDILALVRRENPAAIVLEMDRPEDAGWDLVRALKAHPKTRHIPVVLCSWDNLEPECKEERVDVYLHKPILYHDFLSALDRVGV